MAYGRPIRSAERNAYGAGPANKKLWQATDTPKIPRISYNARADNILSLRLRHGRIRGLGVKKFHSCRLSNQKCKLMIFSNPVNYII